MPVASRAVGKWLLGCAGLVAGAVTVGGLTRLTGSSLSMVDFNLFLGIVPPLSSGGWQAEFDRYKQYPDYEYKLEKSGEMTLTQFKFHYIMEYLHRMGGRTIALAFAIPCAYFWSRGHFHTNAIKTQMAIAGALILMQGIGGWYMVKSGLDPSHNSPDPTVPRVSQYRQAMHLGTAFAIYSIFLWNGLRILFPAYDALKHSADVTHSTLTRGISLKMLVPIAMGMVLCTALMGNFVSGTDAGKIHNTWPKFDGQWAPDNLTEMKPVWRNFFENRSTIQFMHRNMAYMTFIAVASTFFMARKMPISRHARWALYGVAFFGTFQASSGILTLLNQVPVWLASIHQNEALGLYTCLLWLATEIRRIPVK